MIEIFGDYWQKFWEQYDACVCTTNLITKKNGDLVMGAGIALEFAQKFPYLPKLWGKAVSSLKDSAVLVEIGTVQHYPSLVAFPTKYDWKEKSSIVLINKSAQQLKAVTDALGWQKVLMTRPGCGNGCLNWPIDVKPILDKVLDNRFHVIEHRIKE